MYNPIFNQLQLIDGHMDHNGMDLGEFLEIAMDSHVMCFSGAFFGHRSVIYIPCSYQTNDSGFHDD